jgi:predicted DNA-binding transcriptional regulator YafY
MSTETEKAAADAKAKADAEKKTAPAPAVTKPPVADVAVEKPNVPATTQKADKAASDLAKPAVAPPDVFEVSEKTTTEPKFLHLRKPTSGLLQVGCMYQFSKTGEATFIGEAHESDRDVRPLVTVMIWEKGEIVRSLDLDVKKYDTVELSRVEAYNLSFDPNYYAKKDEVPSKPEEVDKKAEAVAEKAKAEADANAKALADEEAKAAAKK